MIEFCVMIEYYGNNRGNIKNLTMDKGVKQCSRI